MFRPEHLCNPAWWFRYCGFILAPMDDRQSQIPVPLKAAFTVWILVWAPIYYVTYGPENYLWLCDVANFLILYALWSENRAIMSSQLVATLIVGIAWSLDLATALAVGFHPFGGTEYMLREEVALGIRLLSLFHLFLPIIAAYGCARLGYLTRGLWIQVAITAPLLAVSRIVSTAEDNINWVYGPFGATEHPFSASVYLLLLFLGYVLLLYLPAHGLAVAAGRLVRRRT